MTVAPTVSVVIAKAQPQEKRNFLRTCLILASLLFAPIFSPPAHAAHSSYFEVGEVRSSDITPFPKWAQVLQRFSAQKSRDETECDNSKCKAWHAALSKLEGKSPKEQVEAVNTFINSVPYILDNQNWGKNDYWATPYEFFVHSGDCEDYAIAKYLSLKSLGIPVQDMRVIILQDLNLGGILHAVLEVKVDGKAFILDNQAAQVIPKNKIYHYKPIYGINESAWWAFRK